MDEPLAYRDGQFLPYSQATIPLHDAGFVQGVAITEQLRTFSGSLFRLDDHLTRLRHSLNIVEVELQYSWDDIARSAKQLVAENGSLLAGTDELGLCVFVTPGSYPAFCDGDRGSPSLYMHTYRLPTTLWSEKYRRGQSLVVTTIQQVPRECWPAELKCRSRMHYWLADRAAEAQDPGAKALLLDDHGDVLEATTANILIYVEGEGILIPPREKVLPGISLAVTLAITQRLGIRHCERNLTREDISRADEVFLSSTPYCLLPVCRLGGTPIADGRPGAVFQRLITAWSDLAGVDIVAQAEQQVAR